MNSAVKDEPFDGRLATFSDEEAEYLAENVLGRLATVSQGGQPHVVPVAFRFDGTEISFGGWNLRRSLKFRNLAANSKVAFVVDDVVSTRPWKVRGVEVRGVARPFEVQGGAPMVRIRPEVVRSWGLEE
ncbi:MAG TPA: PPOX class F420-dependent oxidoreductase [Nitrososphaerales archaeon]|nr:PPOX class F420-dependent oxidoreductase [Nitrososphaerales archaeon]